MPAEEANTHLDDTEEVILRTDEVILVHDVVLRACTDEPHRSLTLGVDSARREDVGLRAEFDVMIGCPDPQALRCRFSNHSDTITIDGGTYFNVGRGLLCEMQTQEGANTLRTVARRCAILQLEVRTLGAADADDRVPHARNTLLAARVADVPLHDDSTGCWCCRLEEHIGYLNDTRRTGRADANNDLRVGYVGKERPGAHDSAPCLAENVHVRRELESLLDNVHAGIEIQDAAASETVDDALQRSGIIRDTVAFRTERLDTDELADIVVGVLRARASHEAATLNECSGLGNARLSCTNVLARGCAAAVDRALNKLHDAAGARFACQRNIALHVRNIGRDVCERNVVKQVRALDRAWLVGRGLNEGSSADDRAVSNDGRASCLSIRCRASANAEGDRTVLDLGLVKQPNPVPVHIDGDLRVVHAQVVDSELLIAHVETHCAAVDSDVAEEAFASGQTVGYRSRNPTHLRCRSPSKCRRDQC